MAEDKKAVTLVINDVLAETDGQGMVVVKNGKGEAFMLIPGQSAIIFASEVLAAGIKAMEERRRPLGDA